MFYTLYFHQIYIYINIMLNYYLNYVIQIQYTENHIDMSDEDDTISDTNNINIQLMSIIIIIKVLFICFSHIILL